MAITKELPLMTAGEKEMEFDGVVPITNKFGKQNLRFVWSDGKYQANSYTDDRLLAGRGLDELVTQMVGRELAIGEDFNWENLVGKKFVVKVKSVNGFDKVISVTPVGGTNG